MVRTTAGRRSIYRQVASLRTGISGTLNIQATAAAASNVIMVAAAGGTAVAQQC